MTKTHFQYPSGETLNHKSTTYEKLEADDTINFKNLVKYNIDDYMLEIIQEFDDIKFKIQN
ncbi:MAG: hypothetical protein IJJ11_08345 [Methanosphaera sp.]|nr:hypothetical protein [Methanosphaera sp.]